MGVLQRRVGVVSAFKHHRVLLLLRERDVGVVTPTDLELCTTMAGRTVVTGRGSISDERLSCISATTCTWVIEFGCAASESVLSCVSAFIFLNFVKACRVFVAKPLFSRWELMYLWSSLSMFTSLPPAESFVFSGSSGCLLRGILGSKTRHDRPDCVSQPVRIVHTTRPMENNHAKENMRGCKIPLTMKQVMLIEMTNETILYAICQQASSQDCVFFR